MRPFGTVEARVALQPGVQDRHGRRFLQVDNLAHNVRHRRSTEVSSTNPFLPPRFSQRSGSHQSIVSTTVSSCSATPTNQLFPLHFSQHSRSHQSIVSTTVFFLCSNSQQSVVSAALLHARQFSPIPCFHHIFSPPQQPDRHLAARHTTWRGAMSSPIIAHRFYGVTAAFQMRRPAGELQWPIDRRPLQGVRGIGRLEDCRRPWQLRAPENAGWIRPSIA